MKTASIIDTKNGAYSICVYDKKGKYVYGFEIGGTVRYEQTISILKDLKVKKIEALQGSGYIGDLYIQDLKDAGFIVE